MKKTLDTNIFLYATVSKGCAEEVLDTYQYNSFNIVLRSVDAETRPKLIGLFTVFSVLRDELSKSKKHVNLIDSDRYSKFREDYPQLYKAVRNYFFKEKQINKLINLLESILNDIRFLIQIISNQKFLYPITRKDYKRILDSKRFRECFAALKEIIKRNDKDREHLCLCKHFLSANLKYKDKLVFLTIDKEDFIKHNNKQKIESKIKNLIIETLPQLDIENILL
jgi:hypothetical protein